MEALYVLALTTGMQRGELLALRWEVTLPDGGKRLRITFEHHLHDEADAQRTLVAMARQAQQDSSRGQG